MVMHLLFAAHLAASPAAAAQTIAEPVRIRLALRTTPDTETAKQIDATSMTVAMLMGEGMRHSSTGKPGLPGYTELWTAPQWSAAIADNERQARIAGLRRLWGDSLTIEPAPFPESATPAGPNGSLTEIERSKLGTARQAVTAMADQFALSSDQGVDFDETKPFQQTIQKAARTHKVDPDLIEAVILAESNGQARLKSPAGARGLMQLTPSTARALGVKDAFNPAQNINGGAKYLKELIGRFNGNMVLAVAAYNAGPNRDALEEGRIPSIHETVNYVTRVFYRYSQLTGTAMIELKDRLTPKSIKWYESEAKRLERVWGPAHEGGRRQKRADFSYLVGVARP